MKQAILAVGCQVALLAYHQVTTFVDFFPFNGARFYSRKERGVEMGVNMLLMGLAVAGTALGIPVLLRYACVYYFVLFGIELVIWWVPYLFVPQGAWRRLYNGLLALGTSDFQGGDTLGRWLAVHQRIHAVTTTLLPARPGRIVPNLEHTLLHAATLVTALVTLGAQP
ncbi:hypothetical protein ACG04R_04160 [Roseateles sp. BYS78W]|uniref:Uncharacterized protein n=1 Tax=Pelomonas candidula TaxID=3299025 RepID=A0ABW7H853_9BURK